MGKKAKGHKGQLSKGSLDLKGRKSTRSLVHKVTCQKVRCLEVAWHQVIPKQGSWQLTLKTVAWILVLGREIQTFEDYFWCHAGRRKTLCKVKKQLMMNDLSHLSKLSKLMQNIESEEELYKLFFTVDSFQK